MYKEFCPFSKMGKILIFHLIMYILAVYKDKHKDDDYHQIKTDEPLSHRDTIQELLIRGFASECDHNIYVGLSYNSDTGVYDITRFMINH